MSLSAACPCDDIPGCCPCKGLNMGRAVQPIAVSRPCPGPRVTAGLFLLLVVAIVAPLVWLLQVEDPVRLKRLIEDEGPVQGLGQTAIALAFASALIYALLDGARRRSYLMLSYLLLFYTLREADYHYKLSEHAKATQFKRFFSHEMIPLSSKLFLAAIVILFLVVLYTYLREHRARFLRALRQRLPWALCALAWGGVFCLSQLIDQVPLFHNEAGQVFEEVFEASAEVLALVALVLFRLQVRADCHLPRGSG